jgi:hypothetical protein
MGFMLNKNCRASLRTWKEKCFGVKDPRYAQKIVQEQNELIAQINEPLKRGRKRVKFLR